MDYHTIVLKIPKFSPEKGIQLEWEQDFFIRITEEDGTILLSANQQGLRSLAKHLLCLADSAAPINSHLHLDETNALSEGSIELILEKK